MSIFCPRQSEVIHHHPPPGEKCQKVNNERSQEKSSSTGKFWKINFPPEPSAVLTCLYKMRLIILRLLNIHGGLINLTLIEI